ncbi:HET domain-containing protein [Astrocystis sublimbata]|nr:HET domain-containing protein [Astrocystis sublimbata]
MWLINIHSMKLEEATPPHLPAYAILSHTWEEEEVTFQDFADLDVLAEGKVGFRKIRNTCELAAARGISYVWIDTCCIDKSSSAELSEAINSMFEWYKLSTVCFAYLSDLHVDPSGESLTLWHDEKKRLACRWFRRGWTLQELLAPANVEFYDKAWSFRGFKTNPLIMRQLSEMTGIRHTDIFRNSKAIRNFSVGERMSWASERETTRLEDLAYCLLGIFGVNMPLLYGEGIRAFQRLQEEIIKISTDMSLFCWKAKRGESKYRGLLARSPVEFATYHNTDFESRRFISWSSVGLEKEFSVTNKGIRIDAELLTTTYADKGMTALRCNLRPDDHIIYIPIRHYRDNVYVRDQPHLVISSDLSQIESKVIYIAKDVDSEMSQELADSVDPKISLVVSPLSTPFQITPLHGWPAEQWNQHGQYFQLGSAKIYTCIAFFQLTNENQKLIEFAAICQRNASAVRSLRYALVSMTDVNNVQQQLQGTSEERVAALSIVEKFIIAGRQTLEIETENTRLYLYISKYPSKDEQHDPNTLYISLASLGDITRSRRVRRTQALKDDEFAYHLSQILSLEPYEGDDVEKDGHLEV